MNCVNSCFKRCVIPHTLKGGHAITCFKIYDWVSEHASHQATSSPMHMLELVRMSSYHDTSTMEYDIAYACMYPHVLELVSLATSCLCHHMLPLELVAWHWVGELWHNMLIQPHASLWVAEHDIRNVGRISHHYISTHVLILHLIFPFPYK